MLSQVERVNSPPCSERAGLSVACTPIVAVPVGLTKRALPMMPVPLPGVPTGVRGLLPYESARVPLVSSSFHHAIRLEALGLTGVIGVGVNVGTSVGMSVSALVNVMVGVW